MFLSLLLLAEKVIPLFILSEQYFSGIKLYASFMMNYLTHQSLSRKLTADG